MIKRATIRGFRSCKNVELSDLGNLTALIGRNGVGKTNVLRAIEWGAQGALSPEVFAGYDWSSFPDDECEIELEWRHGEKRSLYSRWFSRRRETGFMVKERLEYDADGQRAAISRDGETVRFGTETVRIGVGVPMLPTLGALLPSNHVFSEVARLSMSSLSRVRYYAFDERVDQHDYQGVPLDEYESWVNEGQRLSDRWARDKTRLRLVHLWKTNEQRFSELVYLLGDEGLGVVRSVGVDELTSSSSGETTLFVPQFRTSDSVERFEFGQLSTGTQRVIRIVLSIIADEGAILLFEHPEDGIHSGLTKKLIALLREYADPTQIVLTSHSSNVLNSLEPAEVRLVTMSDAGETTVRPLSDNELQTAESYISNDGPLSEFLNFVE